MRKTFIGLLGLAATTALAGQASAEEYIKIGNLYDFTGRTAGLGHGCPDGYGVHGAVA